ncbi:MAG: DUF3558 domain-containing protein [Pseudonocardiaceae bacterium]
MRIRLTVGVIAIGFVVVLAGCGPSTNAPPEPAESSSSEAASPIPLVKNPRDVAAMAQRPCELLTSLQATGFGLDVPPRQREGLLGTQACVWTSTTRERQTYRTVDLSMFTNNPTLEVGYEQDRTRPSFELIEIAGYPALVSRPLADQPICDIDAKPAERQSVSVTYESKELRNSPQQACVVGKQVMEAVLMNLPPKS